MRTTRRLLVGAGLAWGVARLVNASLRDVEGGSMATSLADGDRVVVLPPGASGIELGSVVVVRDPRRPRQETIKRVVALPGQSCELRDGVLHLDGVAHDEPYVATPTIDDHAWEVPADHLVVLGDNRLGSTDSRTFGPVSRDLVVGVAALSLRPLRLELRRTPVPRRDVADAGSAGA